MVVAFQREVLTAELAEEALPLAQAHWAEVDIGEGLELDPDWYQYFTLQEHGLLYCFTARLDGELIGYMTWVVLNSLHHAGIKQASEDALFVKQDRRGLMAGMKLIKFAENYLLEETGAQLFSLRVKMTHDFGRYLERAGYELVEKTYEKRVNGCVLQQPLSALR